MIESVFKEARSRMDKIIVVLESEFKRIRTGRASLSFFDDVKVDYYGTMTQLSQMATLAIPESRLITIQPWDISIINNIEKALLKSDLGLTPSNDGKIIRISIPRLTEERRKKLVKIVQNICEKYKIAVRNARRDSNELFKNLKKDGDLSEDNFFKAQEKIQNITHEYTAKIDDISEKKVKEILEF